MGEIVKLVGWGLKWHSIIESKWTFGEREEKCYIIVRIVAKEEVNFTVSLHHKGTYLESSIAGRTQRV